MDLKALGFKCGIEIHQRLATQRKLFCECRNEAFSGDPPRGAVRRRLRAVVGELGRVDPAAAFEASRGKEYEYQLFEGTTCLVELDEEPPHLLDHEALDVSLALAELLACKPVDEVHVMRKTVVDGSAVSAFQRTALLATGGRLETPRGPVGIQSVCVEEESAGIVEKRADAALYRLDRLGVPLVEIATEPDIQDGPHAREVAEALGMLLRGTGKVQRGLGTIRQDLNVSIRGGHKVEIKGAQELEDLPALVENEARRQHELLGIREELKRRTSGLHNAHPKDLSALFGQTAVGILAKGLAGGGRVLGARLAGFAGLLGRELMPGHRLGTELSDYAKASAGVKGLLHSDENLSGYGFTQEELASLGKELGLHAADGWAIVVDEEPRARRALEAVLARAERCFQGVPPETRKAEGQRSVFLRPLPGAARMYPETDAPPVRVTAQHLQRVRANLPPTHEERRRRYLAAGLNEDLASLVLRRADFALFERLLETRADPTLVATLLTESWRALQRAGLEPAAVPESELRALLEEQAAGRLTRAGAHALLEALAKEPGAKARDLLQKLDLRRRTGKALQALVTGYGGKSGAFERVMRDHRVRVDAGELRALLEGPGA